PDLMTVAKGLGGGYEPVGAVLLGRHIYDSFANGSGYFQHGHTYMGHPLAWAPGLAAQETIRRDNLLANRRDMAALLRRGLGERFGNHPHVGDIRGRGLFQAVELVEDRSSKAPFDPAKKLHAKVKKAAMARGLMVYPMGGTIDGTLGDHVLLAPPFIVTSDQIGEIVDRLGSAIDDTLAEIPTACSTGGNEHKSWSPAVLQLARPSRAARGGVQPRPRTHRDHGPRRLRRGVAGRASFHHLQRLSVGAHAGRSGGRPHQAPAH